MLEWVGLTGLLLAGMYFAHDRYIFDSCSRSIYAGIGHM